MTHYAVFLCKRMICRKSNLCFVAASILVILVFLVMNIRTQDAFRDTIESQIKTDTESIELYRNQMSGLPKDSQDYLFYQESVESTEAGIQAYQKLLTCYDKEDWPMVYRLYCDILRQQKQIIAHSAGVPNGDIASFDDLSSYTDKQLAYFEYLEANNLEYENLDYPIFGLSFTASISQILLPVVITVCCIYVLAQLFTVDNPKGIHIGDLLPLGKRKVFFTKILVGTGMSVFIFLFFLFVSFLLASLFSLNAGLGYPSMIQDKGTGAWEAVKTIDFLKDWLIIGILFYIGLALFTYLLSLFIKEDAPLLLTVLCVTFGLAYLPNMIGCFRGIAEWIPMTYMHFADVANGTAAIRYANTDISVFTGVWILSAVIIIQLIYGIWKNRARPFEPAGR